MPISQWGFAKFGNEIRLDKTKTEVFDKFKAQYEELSGTAYGGGFQNGYTDVQSCFDLLTEKNPDLDTYYKDGVSAYKTINSFSELFYGAEIDYVSLFVSAAMSGTADFLTFFMENGEKINEEHAAVTYVSWVLVLTE